MGITRQGNLITTSMHGRRLALQRLSSGGHGGAGEREFLVGPDAFREGCTTGESTATDVTAYGISRIVGTSVDSSSVFTLEPPIPGVEKHLWFSSTGNTACYVKTKNSEVIQTTLGSSHTTIKSTIGGICKLVGVTTAIWAGLGITSGTSSQAGGFTLSTST